jgi:hypothetical protein
MTGGFLCRGFALHKPVQGLGGQATAVGGWSSACVSKALKRDTTTVRSPGPLFVAKSYGQTPLESQNSNVRIERLLTLEVKPLIKLTPKFPRNVAPTAFPVPAD